jgi:hypothetical protein
MEDRKIHTTPVVKNRYELPCISDKCEMLV